MNGAKGSWVKISVDLYRLVIGPCRGLENRKKSGVRTYGLRADRVPSSVFVTSGPNKFFAHFDNLTVNIR